MKVNMGFQKLKSSVLSGMSELLLPDVFEGDTTAVWASYLSVPVRPGRLCLELLCFKTVLSSNAHGGP